MHNPIRVLLLITWSEKKKWPFVEALRDLGFECDVIGAEYPRGYNSSFTKILFFWSRYILIGTKAFIRRKDYDVILGWQQVAGMVYGVYKCIFRSKYPKLVILNFTYPARKSAFILRIRKAFVKFVLKATDSLWCLSEKEAEVRYRMFDYPKEKTKSVPITVTDISDAGEEEEHTTFGKYILSVGNEREYHMLCEAVRPLDTTLHIVTQPYNLKGLDLPPNVVPHHVFGQPVMDLYKDAGFVVVPMKDPNRPGGESVLFETMAFGKAMIITRTITSVDYITHMDNGILVEPHNQKELQDAIAYLLANPDAAKKMGEKNRRLYKEKYSTKAVVSKVSRHIYEILERA